MGQEKQYILTVGVESEDDITPMENAMQEVLLDLYDIDGVESITVIDNSEPDELDDDMTELVDILDRLESKDVMHSIEIVREMEDDVNE